MEEVEALGISEEKPLGSPRDQEVALTQAVYASAFIRNI